ncbi:class I adenylate-forming enzyme family protein [Kitasatospora brasiliensis]|uniref:class I adenylate-forming enzyme family protein n=1 Tax=Kitasatospora brasiliensis TaxID=3058040 RepID=UPI00292F3C69|nr:AMP-binding protein [Kitasatospora sp. K002]
MSQTLTEALRSHGDREAIVFHGRTTTYRTLLTAVEQWRARLDEHGIRAGQVVALESAYSPQACAALVALIEAGAIIVPLVTLPDAKRAEFHEIAEVETVITLDGTDADPSITATGRSAGHELFAALRREERPGLVLFSSGTTGRSKASVLDFTKVLARYRAGRPARTLSFLNLDHIGGINTLLHTLVHGGAVVTVAERTPDSVFGAIEAHRVEVLPTTPTFLTMALVSGACRKYDASSLRLVSYGTEPMPEQTLRAFHEALPGIRLKQTYGLSELGILPTKSKDDSSLWVKLGSGSGFDYKIVDGVLWVRSEMAMLGYLNAPAPFDEEGYFNTQDMVVCEGEYLKILGRASEIINVGGEKVYPAEVENVVLEVDNIADVTVSGRRNPVTGMVVQATVKLVRPEDEQTVAARVQAHCAARLEPYKTPLIVRVSADEQHSDRFKKLRSAA